jgi:hypothetical protein
MAVISNYGYVFMTMDVSDGSIVHSKKFSADAIIDSRITVSHGFIDDDTFYVSYNTYDATFESSILMVSALFIV